MDTTICSSHTPEGWPTHFRAQVSCDDIELAIRTSLNARYETVSVGRRHEKIRVFVVAFLIPHRKSGLKKINLPPRRTRV